MWSSFKSQQILTESWRKFLKEEDEGQLIYGLNSTDNPDSLQNLLSGVLDDEKIRQIINLISIAADDEGIMLEAVTLQGSKSEKDRIFSRQTTREILQGLSAIGLNGTELKSVIKVLNKWGRLNTVKFEKPVIPTPVTPVEEPDEEDIPTSPSDIEEPDEEGIPTPPSDEKGELPSTSDPDAPEETGIIDDLQREVVVPLKIAHDTYRSYASIFDFINELEEDYEEIGQLYDNGEYFAAARKTKEFYELLKSERAQKKFKIMKRLWENDGIDKSASDMTNAEIDEALESFYDYVIK